MKQNKQPSFTQLFTWEGDTLLGVFSFEDSGRISFQYTKDATHSISSSMPLGGQWHDDTPFNFLDGLLPDNTNERWIMSDSLGAPTAHIFDLLNSVDATGGLSFSNNAACPSKEIHPLELMTDEDIEAKIIELSNRSRSGWEKDTRVRFSLAGMQSKFTIVRYGDNWYWPSVGYASTHIVKPDAKEFPLSSYIECATMDLAGLCGLLVPKHGILQAGEACAFIIERFDRAIQQNGLAKRLRVEDMTQALGLSREEKYSVDVGDIVALLEKLDPSHELSYEFFDQLIFNTHAGNCDAHAKNYTLIMNDEGVSLSPLYDSLNTLTWPSMSAYLAMPINEKYDACNIAPDDWQTEAVNLGLDGDRIGERAVELSKAIQEHAREAFSIVPKELKESALEGIKKANQHMPHQSQYRDFDTATTRSRSASRDNEAPGMSDPNKGIER